MTDSSLTRSLSLLIQEEICDLVSDEWWVVSDNGTVPPSQSNFIVWVPCYREAPKDYKLWLVKGDIQLETVETYFICCVGLRRPSFTRHCAYLQQPPSVPHIHVKVEVTNKMEKWGPSQARSDMGAVCGDLCAPDTHVLVARELVSFMKTWVKAEEEKAFHRRITNRGKK